MIIATFIIQEQLFYIQHRKLGYDRNHVLVVPGRQNHPSQTAIDKTGIYIES